MDEQSFGPADPQHNFFDLQSQLDRERGFLTESDRQYLLEQHLEGHSARAARQRIRERVLRGYFDLRFLPYILERDKQQIFDKATEDDGLHLLNAVKAFVKFNHDALAETGFDFTHLLEEALEEAESERALEEGKYVDVDVTISLDAEHTDTSELHKQFKNGESLTRDELAALVSTRYIDVDLADALYHQARDLHADPRPNGPTNAPGSRYSWEDPDEERAEEVHQELRRLFHDEGIESFEEFETAWFRFAGDEKLHAHRLHDLVQELGRTAPYFTNQMAEQGSVSEADMERLHEIIWNPKNESIESIIRPWAAGEDWVPSEDENLKKFAARVEVAHGGGFRPWGAEHEERWEEFLETIDFDAEEWEEYMNERRVARLEEALEESLEEADAPPDAVAGVEDYDDLLEALDEAGAEPSVFDLEAATYGYECALEAAARLTDEGDDER